MGQGAENLGVALELARLDRRADPLEYFTSKVWACRALVDALSYSPPIEVLWHAGNSGSKTTHGTAVVAAFLEGKERLLDHDGSAIPIPLIPPPVAWVMGIPSYKLGGASTVGKLREFLGIKDQDYTEAHAGGEDQVTVFTVRHRLARDRSEWSKLYVFPYEGVVPESMRLDGWYCDEPPPYRFLDALRNRGKAGRPLRGFMTLTPIEMKLWEPIFAEFPTEHRRAVNGRIRLQSSLYDNKALTAADIARAEDAVRTSPWRVARLYGDPVNIAGTCPFDTEELVKMREEATDGTRYGYEWAQRDGSDILHCRQHAKGILESWGWPASGDRVVIVADPSSGVREPDKPDALQPRNPSGLVVGSIAEQRELLRFNGYVRAHELGQMACAVANKCPHWILVHEAGGYGDAFVRGFQSSPRITQGELWYDRDAVTGKPDAEPGWKQTSTGLGRLMSALQRAIEMRGLKINSRSAIDNFLRTRLDANERWDRGDGKGPHGEDVIIYGIMAYVMERSTLPRKAERFSERPEMARIFQPNRHSNGEVAERW